MKIDVTKLSEDREMLFSEEWDAEEFDLNVPGWMYQGPLGVKAVVKRDSGVVVAKVSVEALARLTCARCFEEFNRPLHKTFKLIYSLDLSKRIIFLDNNIREELILDYPQKILCKEECRGLCLKCGADLNEEKCKCKVQNFKEHQET